MHDRCKYYEVDMIYLMVESITRPVPRITGPTADASLLMSPGLRSLGERFMTAANPQRSNSVRNNCNGYQLSGQLCPAKKALCPTC